MSHDLSRVRNIGIVAHIDAGKTTTTERILFYTGRTHRMGDVDDGTTTTDFDEQEQQRGITIYSAAVSCPWRSHTINLIDTPGHVDFTAEVERSLRVLDGMVAVFDAKEGVEAQSETVWRQAEKYGVPRICLINKMDRIGADFERAVASLTARLSAEPLVLQLPIGAADEFAGLIDLIEMKAVFYEPDRLGAKFHTRDIPDEMRVCAARYRRALEETVAEQDERLMDKYGVAPFGADEIRAAIRVGTVSGAIHPVLCGSALRYIGVQLLLDAVCDYLPSPLDVPPVTTVDTEHADRGRTLMCDPDGALAALVFKIVAERPVDLFFLRLYSGTLKSNARVLNTASGEKENVSRIYRMFAKRRDQLDRAVAGDIVAVIGPKHALTGHTLCDPRRPVLLESIEFPESVISVSVEPKSSRDRDKLLDALTALRRQDPTVTVTTNRDTGQTLIGGMGELHLEVVVKRLESEMGVPVSVGKPRVSYRETVSAVAEAGGRFDRQVGAKRHFAAVRCRLEPRPHVAGRANFEVVVAVPEEEVGAAYAAAAATGITQAAQSGRLGGYPVIDWTATIIHGEQDDTDSSELAFEHAGRMAFDAAMSLARPVLLQPIMVVEVVTSEAYLGAIMADMNTRNAIVRATQVRGQDRVILADVPLAEMFGYVTRLRSLSQGRATSSIMPSHYAPVSAAETKRLLG